MSTLVWPLLPFIELRTDFIFSQAVLLSDGFLASNHAGGRRLSRIITAELLSRVSWTPKTLFSQKKASGPMASESPKENATLSIQPILGRKIKLHANPGTNSTKVAPKMSLSQVSASIVL